MSTLAIALFTSLAVAHPGDVVAPLGVAPQLPALGALAVPAAPSLTEVAPVRSGARDATLVGSIAVAATGVALMTWALVRSQDDSRGFQCLPTCSGGPVWARMFRSGNLEGEITDADITGTGPALFPLGLSFVTASGTTLFGSEVLEEPGVPWISMLAGAAMGALTYGVLEAVETEYH